ncbi:MAG: hypothetical protein Q6L58_00770 [Thermostichales cyanobacterium BF3_bins_165]
MVFPLLAVLHLIVGVSYLVWRLTEGVGPVKLWSLVVWMAEVFFWGAALGWSLSCLGRRPIPVHPELAADVDVDVWLIRRWDSLSAVQQSLRAIQGLDYPQERLHVRLLDLEDNQPLRSVLESQGVAYFPCPELRDPWEVALSLSMSPVLLFLEPGHLPDPDLLRRGLPVLLAEAEVAYVQAQLRALGQPQVIHPLQQITVVGQDGHGVAPLLGTGCLIRREALAQITPLDSRQPLTLGSRLHRLGWRGELLPAQVTGVLLPLRNRRVALLGILNALKVNPILGGQASQLQRFQYLWLGLWSLSGWATLIYLLVPVVYLIWGIPPVPSFNKAYWLRFLPYILLGRLAWIWAFWGSLGLAWQAERQMGSQFFQSLQAAGQWLLGQKAYREQPSQWSIWPQVVMTGLLLVAIVVGCLRFAEDWEISWAALIFALLWSIYGLAIVTARPPGVWDP